MYSDSPLMRRPSTSTANKNVKWTGWVNKTSIVNLAVNEKKSSKETPESKEQEEKESDVTISETVVSNAGTSEKTSPVGSNELLKEDEDQSMNMLKQFKCCEELLMKIKNQLGIDATVSKEDDKK